MIQKTRYVVTGIDQDTAPDKRNYEALYDAENIRIVNNGRNLSVKPIKEPLEFSTPDLPTSQEVIGSVEVDGYLYIFTTNNLGSDYLRRIDSNGNMITIFSGDYDFNSNNRIEAIANYENENIIKIYWTDGVNMLRFVNVVSTSYPLVNPKINVVQPVTLVTPTVSTVSGGTLPAGKIQYVYSLYDLQGTETVLSPVSEAIALTKYFEGAESGQSSGLSVQVTINGVDTNFDYIRVYSITYTEVDQTPTVIMITDEAITDSTFIITDDGNSFVSELTVAELTTLGGKPLVVQTLATKRNRLFVANYSQTNFDVDLDLRVMSHNSGGTWRVEDVNGGNIETNTWPFMPTLTHDCINSDYNTYRFQRDGVTLGAEGLYMKVGYSVSTFSPGTIPKASLKQREIYRVGAILFNGYGQATPVKWMCDIKIRDYGAFNYIVRLTTQLNSAGVTVFNNNDIVGYQVVLAKRNPWDRSVISQGFLVPGAEYVFNTSGSRAAPYIYPYYITKDITSYNRANISTDYYNDTVTGNNWGDFPTVAEADDIRPVKQDDVMFFYSTDTMFETAMESATKVRILGTAEIASGSTSNTKIAIHENGVSTSEHIYTPPGDESQIIYDGFTSVVSDGSLVPNVILGPSSHGAALPLDTYYIYHNKVYNQMAWYNTLATQEHTLAQPSELITAGAFKSISGEGYGNYIDVAGMGNPNSNRVTATNYVAKFAGAAVLKFQNTTWHQYLGTDWRAFASTITTTRRLPIVEIYRDLTNQYGGGSYETKLRGKYLTIGAKGNVDLNIVTHHVGDVYVGPLMINRTDSEDDKRNFYWNTFEYITVGVLENNHNVFARTDNMYSWSAGITAGTNYQYFRIADNHKLHSAYNIIPDSLVSFGKPANYTSIDKYYNVVQASKLKYPNELIDSWTQFPVNETMPLEGVYGDITRLYNFRGEIFAFQPKAVSVLSINPRIQTQATDGVNIELGIGDVLYDYRYLTTVSGTGDKFSVTNDARTLYYYDRTFNTINTLADEKLSTMLGVKKILDSANGVIWAVYHRKRDEVLFSVDSASSFTLVYSTIQSKFVSKDTHGSSYDRYNYVYGDKLLIEGDHTTPSGLLELYAGSAYKIVDIEYLFSPVVGTEKVFHNLEYRMYGSVDFEQIQVIGNLNDSSLETPTIYNKFDIKRLHLPRISGTRERFREPYILVKLRTNTGVTTGDFSLDDMVIMYNIKG
jgi:hypothetical protein